MPMTSEKKIAANRLNGKKSRGPNTVSGKLQSSRNAWRHGLAATADAEPTASPAVKRMANAICGNEHSDPDLYDLAVTIARWQIVLLEVRRLKQLVPTDEASEPLDRYERRARSHRNRAIRMFEAVTIVSPFLNHEIKGR
jgi:hypothetical protein